MYENPGPVTGFHWPCPFQLLFYFSDVTFAFGLVCFAFCFDCLAFVVMMRAVEVTQFGGPEVLKMTNNREIPKPENTQVLIEIRAAGVNPIDTYIRSGQYPTLPCLPYTPGLEAAGIVSEIGPQSSKFKKGDRVFCVRNLTGAYAEFAVAEESFVFALHDSIDFEGGAAIGIAYSTAVRALVLRCAARLGETVLVHGGSGAVGLATCQLARASGLRVLATAGTPVGMEAAKQSGAHQVFNHHEEGYTEQIMQATNNEGVDIVIEMLANVNLQQDLMMTRSDGRIAIIGNHGAIEINPRHAMMKEISIYGIRNGKSTAADMERYGVIFWWGQQEGWLRPVIANRYDLTEAAAAHEDVMTHSGGSRGKIILTV